MKTERESHCTNIFLLLLEVTETGCLVNKWQVCSLAGMG